MARDNQLLRLERDGETYLVEFKWTVSRGRDTYGYNICTAYVDGQKVGRAMGGGYDMHGKSMDNWLETKVRPDDCFYGLLWANFDTEGVYMRYSDKRTDEHTVPQINGACGFSNIVSDLGFKCKWLRY